LIRQSLQTLRFAIQASHVKNQVAKKAKKDKAAQDAEDIEDGGNLLQLTDGIGSITLPDGRAISVQGAWCSDNDSPCVICLHDAGLDGSQFAGLLQELSGKVGRVLAPSLAIEPVGFAIGHTMSRHAARMASEMRDVLAMMDWLGVPKAYFVG
jgi:hypothetical protein